MRYLCPRPLPRPMTQIRAVWFYAELGNPAHGHHADQVDLLRAMMEK